MHEQKELLRITELYKQCLLTANNLDSNENKKTKGLFTCACRYQIERFI